MKYSLKKLMGLIFTNINLLYNQPVPNLVTNQNFKNLITLQQVCHLNISFLGQMKYSFFVDGNQNCLVGIQLPKIEFPFNYLGEGGPSIVFY